MTLRKSLLAAAVLVLSVPVVPALANDDEDYGHTSHDRYHDRSFDQHERAHDEGFRSRGEHRGYHRYQRDQHDDAHGYQAPRYSDYYPRRQYRFYREH